MLEVEATLLEIFPGILNSSELAELVLGACSKSYRSLLGDYLETVEIAERLLENFLNTPMVKEHILEVFW